MSEPLTKDEASAPHKSVLAAEVVELLAPLVLHTFIDATVGAGGHSGTVLAHHPELTRLLGIDRDQRALCQAAQRLAPWGGRVQLAYGNFDQLETLALGQQLSQVDALLMDIGVSSMQLDEQERGFSFRFDGPLDMRMDPESGSPTAADIVNSWSSAELVQLFFRYGEERQARYAVRLIDGARKKGAIDTCQQLAALLEPLERSQPHRGERRHPATRIFQALRIAVNDELGCLERALPQAFRLLKPGGRLLVITFHSLEDRIVKQYFAQLCSDKQSSRGLAGLFLDKPREGQLVTKKPLVASELELRANPRARSSKLRAIEKL